MLAPVVFYEYVYQAIVLSIAFCSNAHLLYQICTTQLHRQLTPPLIVNIAFWILLTFTGTIHASYIAVVGHSAARFSAPWVFWTAVLYHSSAAANSMSVSFLLLDRITIINSPTNNPNRDPRYTFLITACSFCLGLSLLLTVGIVEPQLPELTVCPFIACMLVVLPSSLMFVPKTIAAILTVILACVFWIKLTKYQKTHTGMKQNVRQTNLLAISVCASEFVLNFLPFLTLTVCTYVGVEPFNFIGPYAMVLIATDSLITAAMYRVVVTKRLSTRKTISVTSTLV